MRAPLLLPIAAATLLAACARTTTPAAPELRPGEDVVAQPGATVRVLGTAVQIAIEGVADSRCPSDVTCVTAGDAAVALRLVGAAAERRDTLRLVMEPRATEYAGYRIALVDVRPYPVSTTTHRSPVAVLRVTAPADGRP